MAIKQPTSEVSLAGSYPKNIAALPIRELVDLLDVMGKTAAEKKIDVSIAEIRSLEGLAGCDVILRIVKHL